MGPLRLAVLPLVLCLLACATSGPQSLPSSTPAPALEHASPGLEIEELPATDLVIEQKGAISVAYQLTVRNPRAEAITLKKLSLKAFGRSPYTFREPDAILDATTIPPGQEIPIAFSMWVVRHANAADRKERVLVHGTAVFAEGDGEFQTEFTQSFDRKQ